MFEYIKNNQKCQWRNKAFFFSSARVDNVREVQTKAKVSLIRISKT